MNSSPLSIIEQTMRSLLNNASDKPSPTEVVAALVQAEKNAKKTPNKVTFSALIGTWRLGFITGTKKARNRAGIVLGEGRYLPNWVKIYLSYAQDQNSQRLASGEEIGTIENRVELGSLTLSLSGLTKFLPQRNILVFDFTRMKVELFNLTLYNNYIRGGKVSEEKFYQEKIGKQAFFAYFIVAENVITARGKGGGLAIWGKINSRQ